MVLGYMYKESCWSPESENNSELKYLRKKMKEIMPWPAGSVRALLPYAMVAGLIPGQGRYKNQPINA